MPLAPNEYKIDTTEPLPEWKRRLGMFTRIVEQEPEPDDEGDPDVEGDDEGQPDEDENGEEDGEGPGDEEDPAEGGAADEKDEPGETKGPSPLDDLIDDGPTLEDILATRRGIVIDRDPSGGLVRNFASWHDFIACAAREDLFAWPPHKRDSHKPASSWNGGVSWDETIRMATITGWPEGRKLLTDALAIVRPKPEPFKSLELSVAGAFPMVPNYCAGDPECMVVDPGADQRNAKPVVRIDYSISIAGKISPEAIMLRGAAVVSLAETLEARGYSTELRIVCPVTGNFFDKVKNWQMNIVFKKAGEPLDLDRAAFAIAHPSVLRRLMFALEEQHADMSSYYPGYGTINENPTDPESGQPGGTIFIPPIPYYSRETVETARLAVQKACEAVLPDIFE